MSPQKIGLAGAALLIMAVGASALVWCKAHQKLGPPGVKTRPIEGSRNLLVELPLKVPGYRGWAQEQPAEVVGTLPPDTSYGRVTYTNILDGFQLQANVVLMGTDRTSIHKPEYCLEGQGCRIDNKETVLIPIARPVPYELAVRKFTATRSATLKSGQSVEVRILYLFWFVAGDRLSADHAGRMWEMSKEMLRSGVLQRWAYVAILAECFPGQEDATFERMKQFITQTVPQFQLVPAPLPEPAAVATSN